MKTKKYHLLLTNIVFNPGVAYFITPGNDSNRHQIMYARTSSIFDGSGKTTGVITLMSNVTKEREVDRMKTEFISTSAHELRTPLTTIQGFSLNKEKCDSSEIINLLVPYFESISPEHTFEIILSGKPVELFVDKNKIEQVISNLLSNAVRYSPKGGNVRVKEEVQEKEYSITVEDEGVGM